MTTPNTPANGGQILTDEPLPCPFCGGAAKTLQYNGTTQATCSGKYVECAGADVMSPVSMWNRRASLSDPAIPTDHDEAVTLLSAVFDAWENGDDCHEEGDPSGTYLGKCFPLDDDVFKRCCDLLNRLNPPRNAAPAIPTVDRNAVLLEAIRAIEQNYTGLGGPIDDPHPNAIIHNGAVNDCARDVLELRFASPVAQPAAQVEVRKATTELSLPELTEQFQAVAALGCDYTLSAGACAMLYSAMTTGKPQLCFGCEGKYDPMNNPCEVCGVRRTATPATVKTAEGE